MNQPSDTSQTLTGNDSLFDPSQAAALLEQATQRARRSPGLAARSVRG